MTTIEEKRVYADRRGAAVAYVASAVGVLRLRIAGGAVGEFSLVERTAARDIAAGPGRIAVATDEDVLVAAIEGGDAAPDFGGTGFGAAVATGYDGDTLLAADADGRVARLRAGEWERLESPPGLEVRSIDGGLLATAGGVYRVHDGELDHAGLSEVRDVSAAGVPLAGTADGLYKLGNGWMRVLEESVETVAADPLSETGRLERAYAVSGLDLYGYDADAGWSAVDRSSAPIVGIAYGEALYAVTERGTALVADETDDGDLEWRSRTLGVGGVTGIAVPLGSAD